MPLKSGTSNKTRDTNIKTLMGEVGQSKHVQSREQAIAIAYSKQREAKAKKAKAKPKRERHFGALDAGDHEYRD